jgi:putative ABC transport system permease protein
MLLRDFGMVDWSNFKPAELSFGQQQKISLIRSLTTDPEIIIADEPTGNLDYEGGQALVSMFRQLVDLGKTIVMVTHDLENVKYCDRVIRIFDGKVIEEVKPKDWQDFAELKKYLVDYEKFYAKDGHKDQFNKNVLQFVENEKIEGFKKFLKSIRSIDLRKINIKTFISEVFFSIATLYTVFVTILYKAILPFLDIFNLPGLKTIKFKLINAYQNITGFGIKNSEYRSIKRSELVDLSLKNLFLNKSRANVTIGGIALGIAFTTFLISLGFGLEALVVSRVANLDQLNQIDVYSVISQQRPITDDIIAEFREFPSVTEVLRIINIAGNISYENSESDTVIYGVENEFLRKSDFTFSSGTIFSGDESIKEIVVNQAFLATIGVTEANAIDKEIIISFVPTEDITLEDEIINVKETYKIVGIITNSEIPQAYIPIGNLFDAGINSYTQARLVISDENVIENIRQNLEVSGYNTTSLRDTVDQVESFFGTIRIVFGVLGGVALAVASLGMFNTLTVSLLERTREVGLMKIIGMKSKEVKELFLTESITMGLLGGFVGIFLGLVGGLIVSLLISIIAITRGFEFLNLTYLPVGTGIGIIFVAAITGILTGVYPATRATRISPLDALRYE